MYGLGLIPMMKTQENGMSSRMCQTL